MFELWRRRTRPLGRGAADAGGRSCARSRHDPRGGGNARRGLRAGPTRSRSQPGRRGGGPYDWPPLLYLAYSRIDPTVTADAVLDTARALLDAGADPNAGYL